jgi:hypothetical protein
MLGQLLLATEAFAADAADTAQDAVANAIDSPAPGHLAAWMIALAAFLVIGTLLFFHRWNRRRVRER